MPNKVAIKATDDNIPKLEQYLRDQFKDTAFNKSTTFPTMSGPPARIHLKPDSQPHARHTPIPIPFHWKEDVKKSLDNDVERGIIAPVPIGSPVEWYSPHGDLSEKIWLTQKNRRPPTSKRTMQKRNPSLPVPIPACLSNPTKYK